MIARESKPWRRFAKCKDRCHRYHAAHRQRAGHVRYCEVVRPREVGGLIGGNVGHDAVGNAAPAD